MNAKVLAGCSGLRWFVLTQPVYHQTHNKITPLHIASEYGHVDVVKVLIGDDAKNPLAHVNDKTKVPVLVFAHRNSRVTVVSLQNSGARTLFIWRPSTDTLK